MSNLAGGPSNSLSATPTWLKFVWYLTDRSLETEFYEARDGWLARNCSSLVDERSYASTLLIVGLAREDMLVEIMLVEIGCIAYIGD